MSNDAEKKELVSVLQRALFYESQYRTALVTDALSFYDVNITKDLIETDFFYKDPRGEFHSTLERVGLSAPCSFTEFISAWVETMIDPHIAQKYSYFSNVRQELIDTYNSGKRDYIVEYWADISQDYRIFINQRYLLTQNEDGDICALSVVKDYTTHQVLEEAGHKQELERFAYYDPITHGYNYIKFKDKLKQVETPGSIISFDIHSFKVINSISGIVKGDEVIATIWKGIVNVLELEKGDLAGHINADHFIIFIPTFDEHEIARKLKNLTLAMSFISSDLNVPQLEPYFGVAKWEPEKRIELSYSEAVAAKHNAKHMQKQNFAFFNEADTQRLIREKQIIDDFENALAKKDFKIVYQPKYNPANRKLVGAEALVRWKKDDGTYMNPGEFIPLFEKNGMIRLFDEYIFRNVCEQQKKWLNEGKVIVPISINLSRVSLYYKKVVRDYKRIAEEIGVETKYLPIEITESAAITNNEIKDIAEEFYKAGFILHMDDFGSGYSSLATLNILHFDTLKLDKSLIDYIGNFGGERLIEHTVLLAKELGMHITAEGVEEEKQVTFLRHIGCDSIQGYFYSKPIEKDKFELLLDKLMFQVDIQAGDKVTEHINCFKQSMIRPVNYAWSINLTKNSYAEITGAVDWNEKSKIKLDTYKDVVMYIANNLVDESYRKSYLEFMDRDKLIENFNGEEIERMFIYRRLHNGEMKKIRLMQDVFKTDKSDDVWMYLSVTLL